jgi:hypothetical protein
VPLWPRGWLVFAACLLIGGGAFAQEGHPLTGTWVGDWSPAASGRRHVTVALEWDGRNVSGTINPGPDAATVRNAVLNPRTWSVRIDAAGKQSITVDGKLANIGSANRTLTGTWTEGPDKGAITLARIDSLSASSAGSLPPEMTYDNARRVTLKGIVTHVDWINPRAFLFVNVLDDAGVTTNWKIELRGGAALYESMGWRQSSLHAGDRVRVLGNLATGRPHQALAGAVTLLATPPRLLFIGSNGPGSPDGAAPRWPDGQVRLGPAPGAKGYWGAAAPNASIDKTAIAAAMPWAKAVYDFRQRTKLKDDPLTRCVPPGGPRQFFGDQGFQFVEQRELGRILVLFGDGDRNWRIIYIDGRPQGQPADVVSSYYGSSVGRWERDTLVVDSVGYNEKFWFMNGGLPHTEALHLTERFTRTDMNRLKYDVTVDDPRTYTKPWNASYRMRWVPDQEIQEFFCEEKTS